MEATIEAKAKSNIAQVLINTDTGNLVTSTVTLNGEGAKTRVTIKVTPEDIENATEYYLDIVQLSSKVILDNITVNGIQAKTSNMEDFEIEIKDTERIASIVATTKDEASTVLIRGNGANIQDASGKHTASQTRAITSKEQIIVNMQVTAEDGVTTKDYTLTINIKESDNSTSYVKVNIGEVRADDGINYKTFISSKSQEAEIEIKSASEKAKVEILNKEELEITNEVQANGNLSFKVKTPNEVTTINYRVVPEVRR